MEKHSVWCPPMDRELVLHFRLPEGYYQTDERYPVMYIFDGHNLFNDADATYGTSWGLDAFLQEYDKPFIMVGLECDHRGNNRLAEYSPYDFSDPEMGEVHGRGKELLAWIINELKPAVDANYRTWPQREATGIGGSSMGGLMAYYGVVAHNGVFGKAACLSPSLPLVKSQILKEVRRKEISPDTRVYLSVGSGELKGRNVRGNQLLAQYAHPLLNKGADVLYRFVRGGQHNEASWARESGRWFDYLWKGQPSKKKPAKDA